MTDRIQPDIQALSQTPVEALGSTDPSSRARKAGTPKGIESAEAG